MKLREGGCLGLRLLPFSRKTQQSTKSQCRWWGGCWRGDATGVKCVGGRCCIVPGGKWNDEKEVKNKIHCGLRRPPTNKSHAAINKKHAGATKEGQERRFNRHGACYRQDKLTNLTILAVPLV